MPHLRADRDRLLRFRQGDRSTLAWVYWKYVDGVVRTVRFGLTAGRSAVRIPGAARAEDLPDLVQEVFARAFARAARNAYDGLRDYGPYLVRLAANLLVDRHRKLGREIVLETSELEGALEIGAPVAVEESVSWLDPELVRHTQAYVTELSDELRAVYQQRFVAGLSQRDAAAALGLTRPRLRKIESRLRQGLEDRLRAAGPGK
jgi:RNA polymerase sigma factor (sigma-70 family)